MSINKDSTCECGNCCECLDIKIGDYVERKGDDDEFYEYEVSMIMPDGKTMSIECNNACPEFELIMADDCAVTKRNNR